MEQIRICKVSDSAMVPTRGSVGAAGWDMYANLKAPVGIQSGTSAKIPTGIAMEIPSGCVGLLFARSGLACKQGVRLANCVGVIDSDYRGEVCAVLHNDGNEPIVIEDGMRIAQIMIIGYEGVVLQEVEQLTTTERGSGGFGSTGLK